MSGVKTASDFLEDLADAAKDAGSFKTEVLAIGDAGAGLAKDPSENEAAKGVFSELGK